MYMYEIPQYRENIQNIENIDSIYIARIIKT